MKICAQMFMIALFVLGKQWKQHKYLFTIEWINKIWYSYSKCFIYSPQVKFMYNHYIHFFFITTKFLLS